MIQKFIRLMQTGSHKNLSGSQQRAIFMTNFSATGAIASYVGFALLYLLLDKETLFPVILVNIVAILFLLPVLYFNSKRRYTLAAVWMILWVSFPVFINLFLYLGYRGGSHIFFILFSLLPILTIQEYRKRLTGLLSGMNLLFFFLTYRHQPTPELLSVFSPFMIKSIEVFTMGFVLVTIVLVFFINQRIIDRYEIELTEKRMSLESALVEVKNFATLDALTGILNRGHMEKRIREELARGNRYGFPISLILFDIDHFKQINDAFGHDIGDVVLKKMVDTVAAKIRETDALGRWGGEEFMLLLPYTDAKNADLVAQKLCRSLGWVDHGDCGKITASFGVVQWTSNESFADLYKRLDNALYAAKSEGRNRVVTDNLKPSTKQVLTRQAWREEWNSGHDEIDRQHRNLINSVGLWLEEEDPFQHADWQTFLDQLTQDLIYHFRYEENVLMEYGFTDIRSHHLAHEKLIGWMTNLTNQFLNEPTENKPRFLYILEEAVLNHMLEEDIKYFPLVRQE
ncbi:MAG: diguanylate cyclase [Erysipelotrichaceae bacterium]